MRYRYIAEGGMIDFFNLAFTHDEIVSKVINHEDSNSADSCGLDRKDCSESSIDEAIEQIIDLVYKKEHEYPVIIRFFTLPNFEYLRMDIYAVAKIDNNRPTFIFGNDRNIIKALAPEAPEIIEL
jgi:hypothetical protein